MSVLTADDNLAKEILQTFKELEGNRFNWLSHYDDLLNYIFPQRNFVFNRTVGDKKNRHLYDSTATRSARKLADALTGLLIPSSTQWVEFSTGNLELDKSKEGAQWLKDTGRVIQRIYLKSNFYPQMSELFLELVSLGTGGLRQEKDKDTVARFFSQPVYRFYVKENSKGEVDTVYRVYKFNLRQMIQEFGKKNVPQELWNTSTPNQTKKYEIVHAVGPRKDFSNVTKGRSLPFFSAHVIKEFAQVLKEGGFEENPWSVPRWSKMTDEELGRSPAMDVLPDVKTLNQVKKTWLKTLQLNMAPPLQVPDNGLLRPVQLKPYGVTYRRGKDKIEPLFNGGNLNIANDGIERLQQDVKEGFFEDLLKIVENDRMTAEEIITRRNENFRGFGSGLFRISKEVLDPTVNRTLRLAGRAGELAPLPGVFEQAGITELDIKYVSPIAKAQASIEAEDFGRAMQASQVVLELQPQSADLINGDEVLKGHMKVFGVDPKFLRSDNEVRKLRQERAEAEQRIEEEKQQESAMANAEKAANIESQQQV